MNILILTGRFGMGHYSAADALKQEILRKDPEAEVQIVDAIDYFFPKISKLIYRGFGFLVSKCSCVYNFLNRVTEEYIHLPIGKSMIQKVGELVEGYQADAVAVVFPMCSQYVSAYKRSSGSRIKLYTYITDISVHEEWIAEETDLYFAGAEQTARELEEKGVDPAKIIVSGIPVKPCFREKTDMAVWRMKKEVLIMGGGLGLLPSSDDLLGKLGAEKDIHVTVITGTNRKLKEELEGKYPEIDVIGYTNHVDEYMRRADLIVTKAGGITTFESIYTGTPMLVIRPFLEQEVGNAEYIEQEGFGKVIWSETENPEYEMKKLLRDPKHLAEMKENMRRIRMNLQELWPFQEIKEKTA